MRDGVFFFFQAEDGIRDKLVTGVQTCALPIYTVKRIWQREDEKSWSSWSNLGGAVQSQLAVVRNKDGRLELFGMAAGGGEVVHCWQEQPNANADWSHWVSLGGSIMPGFAVEENALGDVEVFAVSRTNSAVRIYQVTPGDSERWTQWMSFTQSQPATNQIAREAPQGLRRYGHDLEPGLTAAKSGIGSRMEVFAVSAVDGTILHRWERDHGGSDDWSPWTTMGKRTAPYVAVAANEDNNLEIFALDPSGDDVIYHRRQISSARDWLDWSTLDDPTFQYAARTWRTDEGLPGNTVQAIAQTSDGYLWVGTLHGLALFDGVEFTSFDAHNTPELRNASITALCADKTGVLWIGTDGGGLVRLAKGVFTGFGKTNGLAGNNVRVIFESKDGSLWIGTTTGLSRYADGQFRNY